MGNVGAVFWFEWKRAMSLTRRLWWLGLAGFPVFIVGLVQYTLRNQGEAVDILLLKHLWTWLLFALIPMLVSILGSLLWTTPAISSELERRSWVYLAVRPDGATAVILGKYLTAVCWVIPAALTGLTLCIYATGLSAQLDLWRLWWTMALLVILSCPAYAAIFLFVGVIYPRRAMVMSVVYTLLFELVISFIPAVINKMTIQYRLRALAVKWSNLSFSEGSEKGVMAIIGNEPPWQHVTILCAITLGLLCASIGVIRWLEFATSSESDN